MINNRQAGRRNRGRNNNGRPNGQNRGGGDSGNRIDNRSRGNAAQLLEKYRNMARDAQLSGDRVNVEYYLQFADHYFRVLADNRARQEEQNPQRFRREEGSSFDENGDDFDNSDDFGMDYMADRTPPPRQDSQRQDSQRHDAQRNDGRQEGQRQERQDNGYRQDNGRQDGQRYDGNRQDNNQRQDYQSREQRADRGEQQEGRSNPRNDRNRNRNNNRDRDYDRAPQELAAAPAPAPVEAPVSQPDHVPEQAHAASGEAAPKRRGRRPKVAAPEGEVQEGLDLAVLPPAISRADNDSDGDEAPAPRKRGRPRRTPAAEAAE